MVQAERFEMLNRLELLEQVSDVSPVLPNTLMLVNGVPVTVSEVIVGMLVQLSVVNSVLLVKESEVNLVL